MKALTHFSRFLFLTLTCFIFQQISFSQCPAIQYIGNLSDYLLVFTNGSDDANWQGSSKGFAGNVAVDGIEANERTSGFVPYAGTIHTNDTDLDSWQDIVDENAGQAFSALDEVALLNTLQNNLENRFTQINALPVTVGFDGVSPASLNNLNTQNGMPEVIVINVTGDFKVSSKINIRGDLNDLFILRWDTDKNFSNGYNGQVKFQSGGAIVPLGGLSVANFVHVAGDISASGGGSTPPPPFPQGPRTNNGFGPLITGGSDFNGGGFFTGYWLTTGSPTITGSGQPYGKTSSLSNAVFVGGWYSKTTKFSMTSGTSGVHIACGEEGDGEAPSFFTTANPIDPTISRPPEVEKVKTAGDNLVVNAWPNPSENQFTIDLEGRSNEKILVVVYDVMGRIVFRTEGRSGERIRFGEQLNKGVYFTVVSQGRNTNTFKLIKQTGY